MELVVILLSSISGAMIGTSVGIYLLYRKLLPVTGGELDATRNKLRSTEFALSSATANLENLKKLAEERDQQAATAVRKAAELEAEALMLRQRPSEDTPSQDEIRGTADTVAKLQAETEAGNRQITELNSQLAHLTTELDQVQNHLKEETATRLELESELSAEHDKTARLTSRITEMESERSHFDLTMQEERQSAAKGIELLLMAQENLSRVFRNAQQDAPVDSNGDGLTHPVVESVPNGHSQTTAETNGHSQTMVAAAE